VTSGSGGSGGRSASGTGWFVVRRARSAVSLWWSSIRGRDVLAASILVALSLGLGAFLLARADSAAQVAFAKQTQILQAAVAERLSLPLEDLAALSSLLESSGRVTRRQFHVVTDALLRPDPLLRRRRMVYAFEWLPYVVGPERLFQETEGRTAGLPEYRFWETGPDGKPREAGRRSFYVPIQYMEPPNARALGFDIASDPDRWKVAEKARDSGLTAAHGPFRLVEEGGRADSSLAVALYAPVYEEGDPGSEATRRSTFTGFVLAIFRLASVLDNAAPSAEPGLGLVMRETAGPGSPVLAERPPGAARLARRDGFEIRYQMPFADRRWSLEVFALPGAFLPVKRGAIASAAVGVLASLLGLATLTALRTISRLRRQAEKVGPYRLVARLGGGAMGVVWEARHALLRRPTAVKVLAPGTEGERSLARFEREVQLTAGLTHPSTIAIYDYGRSADGTFYYAMELLRGLNLTQLVAFDGALPPARVVHLLRQACGALAEAHAAGLIHRDIKPANLMVCVYGGIADFLKILDFGLVKDLGAVERAPEGPAAEGGGDAALSQDGSLLGTPLYMAPEGMSDPAGVDARADLFGLGAVGYFLLTGKPPFPGRTALEVFAMARQGPPAPLSAAAAHPVPAALEEAIRRCLSFDREERPSSAEELETMLEACAVSPCWTVREARAWWRDRGQAALARAALERDERPERGLVLMLSSDSRLRS
ncbi:MAG: protein kinase domain-containing protein, partial [Acidobacteriota bacterium]